MYRSWVKHETFAHSPQPGKHYAKGKVEVPRSSDGQTDARWRWQWYGVDLGSAIRSGDSVVIITTVTMT